MIASPRRAFVLLPTLAALALAAPARAQEPDAAPAKEADDRIVEKAVGLVVKRLAPCVVKIDTLGDLSEGFVAPRKAGEKGGGKGVLARRGFKPAYGPSTGLVISKDGYILTSAFTLQRKPRHIFVSVDDGRQFVARVVGEDRSRGVVLLKVKADKPLPTAPATPKAAIKAGAFCIAIGRGYGADGPNVSLGIVSAKDRISGKALQSSALISPANYGGALVGIDGRVMGLIVPLNASGRLAGVDLYDSGIGFAVPIWDLMQVLPRLIQGETLEPAFLGVQAKESRVQGIEVEKVVAGSPAEKAGLAAGDVILELDGEALGSYFQFNFRLGAEVAGSKIKLKVKRGDEELVLEATLGARPKAAEAPPKLGAPGAPEKTPPEKTPPEKTPKDGEHKDHDHKDHEEEAP